MSWNNNEGPWGGNGDNQDKNPWEKRQKGNQNDPFSFINDLFSKGQKKFNNGFTPGDKNPNFLWLIAGGILVLWLLTGIYTVQQDEQAAVLRFGKWTRTANPGLNYHLPLPFETALIRNVTAINVFTNTSASKSDSSLSGEGALMLTGDENIADVQYAVNWRIKNLEEFLFSARSPEQTCRAAAESIVREVIAQTPIAQALSDGRSDINNKLRTMLQKVLDDYKIGIEITQVELLKVTPPTADVIDAYLDVQRAKADMERKRNEAEFYRNSIVPVARGEAKKILQDAEGYKASVVADIDGETQRFELILDQYQLAPTITKDRLYIETMQNILEGATKVITSQSNASGIVPYLPLPELKKAAIQKEANQ